MRLKPRSGDGGSSVFWKASNAESDRLIYRAACSFTNKLINKSRAASNIESINEASKNPKRLWSTIKSLLHSSPPSEQLSPSISQPLANSLASFFHQKIVALKESISLKLLGNPSPFDFDQPHCNELLSDFMPVTPAEVSKLLQSMSNKSSQLDYIPTSLHWSHVRTFSPSSFHILQTYHSPKLHFHWNSNLHSSRHFWKSLAYRSLSSRTSGLFQI